MRSISRGEDFSAYLNFVEQNPTGVSEDLINVVQGATANDITTSTGKKLTLAGVPLALGNFAAITVPISDYKGRYRVFLRGKQTAGVAGEVTVQIITRISGFSGPDIASSDILTFSNTSDDQFLDFGTFDVPGVPISDYLADSSDMSFVVLASLENWTAALEIYDLVIIPVDEWVGDFTDTRDTTGGVSTLDQQTTMEVDSVTYPKVAIYNVLTNNATNAVEGFFNTVSGGHAILQANADQKLWAFSARRASVGSTDWRSEIEVAHSVQVFKADRYLGLRGSR